MKQFISNHFINYFIIGLLCYLIDISLFFLLVSKFFITAFFSNIISSSLGITISFFLNSLFNFKVSSKVKLRLLNFYLVSFFGIIFSSLLIIFFISIDFSPLIAKILTMPAIFIFQYNLNKYFTFSNSFFRNN